MDKLISVYWFAILLIVAGTIVYISFVFYGQPYDIREYESNFLAEKIAECIVPDFFISDDFLNGSFSSGDFLKFCKINFDTEDYANWKSEGQYYLDVKVYDFDSGSEVFSISEGNSDLKDSCSFQEKKKQKNIPFCVQRKFYSIGKNDQKYFIEITSIVDKSEKNVA